MSFSNLLRHRTGKWDNPVESLGPYIGLLSAARYQCWEASGKAREAFQQLSPEIKELLEASNIPPGETVTWSIYMVGRTEQTASPKVLICSTEKKTRKHILKLIKESKIMSEHPGIGLGDISVLPDRQVIKELARDAIQTLLPVDHDAEGAVLAEDTEPSMGMRLFVVDSEDYSLYPITAGPLLMLGNAFCILTAAHPFKRLDTGGEVCGDRELGIDDCSFEGISDDDDDDDLRDEPEPNRTWSDTSEEIDCDQTSLTAELENSASEGSDTWSASCPKDCPTDGSDSTLDSSKPGFPNFSRLRYFGQLIHSSLDGPHQSLDYALISIKTTIPKRFNTIPLVNSVTNIGEIAKGDVSIVAAMPQHGLVRGELTATPSFIRFPGQSNFQLVYPLRLGVAVSNGDCGTAILDQQTGNFYGHIVAGGPGSRIAYLVPSSEVAKDIEARFGHRPVLMQPNGLHPLQPEQCFTSKVGSVKRSRIKRKAVNQIVPQVELGVDSWPKETLEKLQSGYSAVAGETVPALDYWTNKTGFVEFFMTEPKAMERISPQVAIVLNFCPEETLEELQSGFSAVTEETVALLYDRTNDVQKAFGREYLGPLTAHQLWLALSKKRFELDEHQFAETNDQTRLEKSQSAILRADRRSIFITDINRWAMMAIMSTATIEQSKALRDTFYRYLAFKSFIGTSIAPNGLSNSFPTFQLAFDLPFYVLRQAPHNKAPQDRRLRAGNDTLRKVTDLTFLQRPTGSTPLVQIDYLCEAQVSVLITGSYPWRWVAYCFVDTYFDSEERKESVDSYNGEIEIAKDSHATWQTDPLIIGEYDANYPVSTPREYFLVVLDSRLRHVKDEWRVLMRRMSEMIETYVDTYRPNRLSFNLDNRLALGQFRVWEVKTGELLRRLSHNLTSTINQLERFQADQKFSTITGPAAGCVPTILANTEQLRIDLKRLEFLRADCDRYIEALTLDLSYEVERRLVFTPAMTSFTLFILSPIAFAAGVSSMGYKNMPVSLTSFLSLVMIFMVLVWLAVGIMLNWERIRSISNIRVFRR